MHNIPRLLTVGEIARRVEASIHRVQYVIRTREIQPHGLAGGARVFPANVIDRVETELNRIATVRTGGGDSDAELCSDVDAETGKNRDSRSYRARDAGGDETKSRELK
jgi:hypothetical protein